MRLRGRCDEGVVIRNRGGVVYMHFSVGLGLGWSGVFVLSMCINVGRVELNWIN